MGNIQALPSDLYNASATLAEIQQASGTAITVRVDVTKADDLAQLAHDARKALGEEPLGAGRQ